MTPAHPHRSHPARTLALVITAALAAAACGGDSTTTANTAASTSADVESTDTEPTAADSLTTRPFEHSQGVTEVPTSPSGS